MLPDASIDDIKLEEYDMAFGKWSELIFPPRYLEFNKSKLLSGVIRIMLRFMYATRRNE